MGSPGAILALADLVGAAEGVFEELTGSLQGWKRKLSGKKGGTLRKKDVTFVAPDGEEVKNRRQLDKYLKAHPGTAISSDFLWSVSAVEAMTPNGTRRRSARLSFKGRFLTEAIDEEMQLKEPPLKRARKCLDNGTENKDDAPAKDERVIKTSSDGVIQFSANQPLYTKERENGEVNGNHEAFEMDVVKVEASAVGETKAVIVETLNRNADAENRVTAENSLDEAIKESLMVKGAIDCNKVSYSVIKEGAENASGEDISKIKEVEPSQPEGF